ncbi:hypothetical protein TSAR_005050 [Trichomalopsis sarcophagae]|uniref:Heparanase n=1 Tax=Trichomalopsis sarcophagae TaxID=543379 RepID=A0A232F8N2_9HYME|nr:hypothetical protein TSAR_005050 [Trichomalopsis sarcophagae]
MYLRLKTSAHNKNKQEVSDVIGTSNPKIILKWLIFVVLMLTGINTVLITQKYLYSDHHVVALEQSQPLFHTVSNKFLSFGLDSSLLRNMNKLPINQEKFVNLARHLSPAYVRVGGTAADCLYFVKINSITETTTEKLDLSKNKYVDGQDITNFTLASDDFLSLYKFTQKARIRMVFDLNTLLRNEDGTWNSDNAREIILFAKGYGMELDWQMGNEPNSFFHVFNITVSSEQLAQDYCELRSMLNNLGYKDSILVGPEANHMGDDQHPGQVYLKNFLENVKDCIDYATWHQYYLNGHVAKVKDFIDPKVFERLPVQIKTVSESIKSSSQDLSMWISETSSAFGGGAPELSDRFVAGFLWLDKLGISAKMGVQTVIRQSFYGGYYAMIGPDLEPNPDWWVAVLYKKFVSEKVLELKMPNSRDDLRLYAHCGAKSNSAKSLSTATIYGVNLSKMETKIYLSHLSQGAKILSYILTSDELQSRNIYLNNQILKLQDDGKLPKFKPKEINENEPIILPPYSMIFLVINNAKISACL